MPYSNYLGGWLNSLDLRGTRSLHTFDIDKVDMRFKGQRFNRLQIAHFNYVAHCCLLNRSNHTYFSIGGNSRVVSARDTSSQKSLFQKLSAYFFGGPSANGPLNARHKREADSENNGTERPLTCLDYANLNIPLDVNLPPSEPPTTEMPTTEPPNICDCMSSLYSNKAGCSTCLDFECEDPPRHIDCSPFQEACDMGCEYLGERRRRASNDTIPEVASNNTDNNSTEVTNLLPEGWFFHENMTNLICTEAALPVSIVTQVYRPCDGNTVSPVTISTESALPIPMPTATVGDTPMPSPTSTTSIMPVDIAMTTPEPTAAAASPTSVACSLSIVAVSCIFTISPTTTPSILTGGWFYPNPNNQSFICIPLNEIPPSEISSSTTPPPDRPGTPACPPKQFDFQSPFASTALTVCSPSEDPFNPCEDLLGEDDILRSFIWVVITLALLGNSLVILVFICYSLILKRAKIELFIVHFFYFHLALADLMMGLYLFTIAVQDLRTMDNFASFDVAWRTGGGCAFAGFCAITSTMVSVYVLVVITVERLYTFSRALRKSHTNKITGSILMVIGWCFGILMGILPLVGVSDYTTTAICLPFDVSSHLALSYVLFLLIFTGLAFAVIAVSYAIIFYQVFYRQRTTLNSVSDRKRWKIELKVALRMGLLVLTNFICWFPIALVGIAAAVGESFVTDITFAKWAMVFIFPINACLNPFLYSVLSKVFRDNLVLLLGKCGLCKNQVSKIRQHRAGITPSVISRSQVSSEAGLLPGSKRGKMIQRFRNFSITSSTADLLGRRSSTMSQVSSEERYRIDLMQARRRRSSEYSSASSEDILGIKVNSRRGSEFSGGSIEEMTTFSNPTFRSSSPVGGSNSTDGANLKGSPRPKTSLNAVPEEDFETYNLGVSVAPEPDGEVRHNSGYIEHEETGTSLEDKVVGKAQHTGIVDHDKGARHHRIIDSETEKDNGVQNSDSGVTTDSEDPEHMNKASPVSDFAQDSDRGHEVISIDFD